MEDTVRAILKQEAARMGRPVHLVNAHEYDSARQKVIFLIYDCDPLDCGGGIFVTERRFLVNIDGHTTQSGIINPPLPESRVERGVE